MFKIPNTLNLYNNTSGSEIKFRALHNNAENLLPN